MNMNKNSSLVVRIYERHSAGCNLYLNKIGHPGESDRQNVCSCGAHEDAIQVDMLQIDARDAAHAKNYHELWTIPELQKQMKLLKKVIITCDDYDWVDLYLTRTDESGEIDLIINCNDYFMPASDGEIVPRSQWQEIVDIVDSKGPDGLMQWVAERRGIPNVPWNLAKEDNDD